MIDFILANYQNIVINTARIFSSVFEIMLAFILANSFYRPKAKIKNHIYIPFFLLAVLIIFLQEYKNIGMWKYAIELIFLLAFLFLLYKGSFKKKLYGAFIFILSAGISVFSADFIFSFIFPAIGFSSGLSPPMLNLLKLTAANIIMIIAAVIINALKKNSADGGIYFSLWASLLLMPIITLITLSVFQYFIETFSLGREIRVYIYFSCLGIVFLNILVFVLFLRLQNQMKTKNETDMLTSQLSLQEISVKNLENAYNRTRQFRHDIKNHLLTMNILAEKGNLEEIKKYLKELSGIIDESSYVRISGISSVDAILNEKLYEAQSNSITTSYDVVNADKNRIKPLDMCIILSNALDNAIEANIKIENPDLRYIKLKIHGNETFSVISVSNPTSQLPEKIAENTFATSKSDSESHGFGLKSIKTTVKKYKGEMMCKCEDSVFTLVVRLNSPPAKEN